MSSSRGNVNSKNKSNSSRLGFGICHNTEQTGVASYPSVYTFTPVSTPRFSPFRLFSSSKESQLADADKAQQTLSQSKVQSKKSLANAEESDEGGIDRKLAL